MKFCRTLPLLALYFCLCFTGLFAAPQPTNIPGTAKGILGEMRKQKQQLDGAVTKKQTDQVQACATALKDLANALPSHAASAARDRVTTVSKRLGKYVDHLTEAVQENDPPGIATYTAGLQKQLDALQAEFPQ